MDVLAGRREMRIGVVGIAVVGADLKTAYDEVRGLAAASVIFGQTIVHVHRPEKALVCCSEGSPSSLMRE